MYTVQIYPNAGGRPGFISQLAALDLRAAASAQAKEELLRVVAQVEALRRSRGEASFTVELDGRPYSFSRSGRQLTLQADGVPGGEAVFWDDLAAGLTQISEDEWDQIRGRASTQSARAAAGR